VHTSASGSGLFVSINVRTAKKSGLGLGIGLGLRLGSWLKLWPLLGLALVIRYTSLSGLQFGDIPLTAAGSVYSTNKFSKGDKNYPLFATM